MFPEKPLVIKFDCIFFGQPFVCWVPKAPDSEPRRHGDLLWHWHWRGQKDLCFCAGVGDSQGFRGIIIPRSSWFPEWFSHPWVLIRLWVQSSFSTESQGELATCNRRAMGRIISTVAKPFNPWASMLVSYPCSTTRHRSFGANPQKLQMAAWDAVKVQAPSSCRLLWLIISCSDKHRMDPFYIMLADMRDIVKVLTLLFSRAKPTFRSRATLPNTQMTISFSYGDWKFDWRFEKIPETPKKGKPFSKTWQISWHFAEMYRHT